LTRPQALFDVAWEAGGDDPRGESPAALRAARLVRRLGDGYVAVGPWLLGTGHDAPPVERSPELDAFAEGCRAAGLNVFAGRWRVPGSPRTVLVEPSALYAQKDDLLKSLWESHGVDSLDAGWDFADRLLFGHAAALAIARYAAEWLGEGPEGVVAQAHGWTAGAAVLSLRALAPRVASIFTAHGTALGEALARGGAAAGDGLAGRSPAAAAKDVGALAMHSLEAAAARTADAVAAVGDLPALELVLFHRRPAEAILPPRPDAAFDAAEALVERTALARAAARAEAGPAAIARPSPAPPTPVEPEPPSPARAPLALPAALSGLETLARNWRWTWDPLARAVLAELHPETWARTGGSALRTLAEAPREALERTAADAGYVARVARAGDALARDLAAPAASAAAPVAYVCAEYGVHASLPVYSGGLGVLAGDHLRAASDLRTPLVAVGLLYRRGYLRQRLEGGLEQVALPETFLPEDGALVRATVDGKPLEVPVPLPGGIAVLHAWRADVGRVPLWLLDADHAGNHREHREATRTLYASEPEARLRQEILLGRGAVRLLARLGVRPSAWHVNEGHGAFALLERVFSAVHDGASFDDACASVRATSAFTTHTPVPAGHDRFPEALVRRHFADHPSRLGISWERFFGLGAAASDAGVFNMTGLALRLSSFVNGVSERHRQVSRDLLRAFTARPEEEVPVERVTNGVHLATWADDGVAALLGAGDRPVRGEDYAAAAPSLDLAALWDARRAARRRLVEAVRTQVRWGIGAAAAAPGRAAELEAGLDEGALWIGFARRFATYKRADLLFRDPARLRAILDRPGAPVRLVVAGKAHPADDRAKDLLSRLARLSSGEFAGRVYLLEGYDLALARALVAGVDVWLNTPRAPLEACGTSGMKAAACGALNLSVPDGWWPEAADGRNGWTIGDGAPHADEDAQDAADAASLYRLLEDEVVPAFFRRDPTGVPTEWLERVRHALATIPPVFDAARMVREYAERAYAPAAARGAGGTIATP
jgi:starch phosphorylase